MNHVSDHDAALCTEHYKGELFLMALKKSELLASNLISLSDIGKLGCCSRPDGTVNVELRVF